MVNVRIFVALEMPDSVRELVGDVVRHFAHLGQMRWVRPEGAHLTLKFLGDVSENRVADVVSMVQKVAANFKPLRLATVGVGGFPRLDRARVLWLGVEGDVEGLKTLHGETCQELEGLGFERESHRFMAHITVGRVRRKPVFFDEASVGKWPSVDFSIDQVSVVKSDLQPGGVVYTGMGYGLLGG